MRVMTKELLRDTDGNPKPLMAEGKQVLDSEGFPKFEEVNVPVVLMPQNKDKESFLEATEKYDAEERDPKKLKEMFKEQDEMVVKCSNITKEQYERLSPEEQGKLIIALRNTMFPYEEKKS